MDFNFYDYLRFDTYEHLWIIVILDMMPTSNSLDGYLRGSLMDLDMTPAFIFLGLIFISTTLGFDTFEHLGLLLFWIWCLRVSFWIDTYEYLWWILVMIPKSILDGFLIWYLRVFFWMDSILTCISDEFYKTYEYFSGLIRTCIFFGFWIWYLCLSWIDYFLIWYLGVSLWIDTYKSLVFDN